MICDWCVWFMDCVWFMNRCGVCVYLCVCVCVGFVCHLSVGNGLATEEGHHRRLLHAAHGCEGLQAEEVAVAGTTQPLLDLG